MANNVKGNGVDTQNERETATLGEEDVNELRMETEERDYCELLELFECLRESKGAL